MRIVAKNGSHGGTQPKMTTLAYSNGKANSKMSPIQTHVKREDLLVRDWHKTDDRCMYSTQYLCM